MATPRLVVAGGTGFLGTNICKSAALRGWHVVSLSRKGTPQWPAPGTPPTWAEKVKWEKADLLRPESYKDKLEGATAVVHSMGILLEADYKGVLQGKESPIQGLKKAFAKEKEGQQDGQLTYEMMNRDSAVNLAKAAKSAGVKTFAYVSAADGAIILPSRYITTKRQAEEIISGMGFRELLVRPGFIYDSSRAYTIPLAIGTGITSGINNLFGGKLPLLGAAGYKPLRAEVIADAVVEAIADENVKGILEPVKMEELAAKVWRRGML